MSGTDEKANKSTFRKHICLTFEKKLSDRENGFEF